MWKRQKLQNPAIMAGHLSGNLGTKMVEDGGARLEWATRRENVKVGGISLDEYQGD